MTARRNDVRRLLIGAVSDRLGPQRGLCLATFPFACRAREYQNLHNRASSDRLRSAAGVENRRSAWNSTPSFTGRGSRRGQAVEARSRVGWSICGALARVFSIAGAGRSTPSLTQRGPGGSAASTVRSQGRWSFCGAAPRFFGRQFGGGARTTREFGGACVEQRAPLVLSVSRARTLLCATGSLPRLGRPRSSGRSCLA